ncbi:hypothetical protein FUT69_02640 [Xylella taiwanensis]|nr:hypothetical protein [Xylella taiwanensis]MCD8459497.1 hypothetical protein [Xylella taiwanensis]MCD8461634.1 hypothetical protein [Xylella taiwanensis]MCD8462338.1 hypothetical protein [Xylella taiwanensis]MCD8466122.1 hypothetical protein [Xylella taiwanensis]MCD8468555.1 hypothetical protein [Xylella taiwanensis]
MIPKAETNSCGVECFEVLKVIAAMPAVACSADSLGAWCVGMTEVPAGCQRVSDVSVAHGVGTACNDSIDSEAMAAAIRKRAVLTFVWNQYLPTSNSTCMDGMMALFTSALPPLSVVTSW